MRGDDLTVEGTFVGEALVGEATVEVMVDVCQVTPEAQEALLEFCLVLLCEMAEEVA